MKKNLWLVERVLSYTMCCASKGLSNRYSVYRFVFPTGHGHTDGVQRTLWEVPEPGT